MALEHATTIRDRRAKGLFWRGLVVSNSLAAIAEDYGMHETALIRTLRGEYAVSRLSAEDLRHIRRRRRLCRHATHQWHKHSVSRLKGDYRMSTDTLNKILDRQPQTPTSVAAFLTGRH